MRSVTPESLRAAATNSLRARFGQSPKVFGLAPGRVELLGNHTDHNRGLVLSAAIDRYTIVAAAPNNSAVARVWSEQGDSNEQFALHNIHPMPRGSWTNYVRGAVSALIGAGVSVRGFDATVAGNVPIGGGLSSSASLECAVAMAVLGLFGRGDAADPAAMRLAELLKDSEHHTVGVQCGVLDQFSSIFGRAGHALFLDCATGAHDVLPLGSKPPAIIVCDSGTPRELAMGKYNERRAECDESLAAIRRSRGLDYESLSAVTMQEFDSSAGDLSPLLARRARHVLTENSRVSEGVRLLRSGAELQTFGNLMVSSHASSRDDFENSTPQLDYLVETAAGLAGFIGAKLSGAGWGGCTVNLVEPEHADAFGAELASRYASQFGITARILVCEAADGAHVITADAEG